MTANKKKGRRGSWFPSSPGSGSCSRWLRKNPLDVFKSAQTPKKTSWSWTSRLCLKQENNGSLFLIKFSTKSHWCYSGCCAFWNCWQCSWVSIFVPIMELVLLRLCLFNFTIKCTISWVVTKVILHTVFSLFFWAFLAWNWTVDFCRDFKSIFKLTTEHFQHKYEQRVLHLDRLNKFTASLDGAKVINNSEVIMT